MTTKPAGWPCKPSYWLEWDTRIRIVFQPFLVAKSMAEGLSPQIKRLLAFSQEAVDPSHVVESARLLRIDGKRSPRPLEILLQRKVADSVAASV